MFYLSRFWFWKIFVSVNCIIFFFLEVLTICSRTDNFFNYGRWKNIIIKYKVFYILQGCHYFLRLKFKVNSRFLPTFYPEFKVFVHFSRFYKLSNITIITIFFSHDRLSQRYTSTSTLSKMNFIQLYHNARDTHSSTNVYIPIPNVRGVVLTHTQSSFFLAPCKDTVATERADKSWFLSALIIPASTCFFFRKSSDSCSFTFFDFTTSISCNLALCFNEISAFFLSELKPTNNFCRDPQIW